MTDRCRNAVIERDAAGEVTGLDYCQNAGTWYHALRRSYWCADCLGADPGPLYIRAGELAEGEHFALRDYQDREQARADQPADAYLAWAVARADARQCSRHDSHTWTVVHVLPDGREAVVAAYRAGRNLFRPAEARSW